MEGKTVPPYPSHLNELTLEICFLIGWFFFKFILFATQEVWKNMR